MPQVSALEFEELSLIAVPPFSRYLQIVWKNLVAEDWPSILPGNNRNPVWDLEVS